MLAGLFSPFFGQSTSLTQMMDAMDRFFSSPTLMDPTRRFGDLLGDNRMPWDVMEDEKSIKLRVDMPGYSKDEVKLSVEDDELVLKADHQTSKEEDDWSTQSYGSYNLRIRLPENVDPSSIKAELKDGVLKVKVPKVEASKKESHTVQVE
jgi:HSP20 family protein